MTRTKLSLLTFVLTSIIATLAHAQAPTPTARVDVNLPSLGVTIGTPSDTQPTLAATVRVVHRSGHGVLLSTGASTHYPASPLFAASPGHTDVFTFDLAYVYRVRALGDDRLGLGIDLFGGPSGAFVNDIGATCAFFEDCTPPLYAPTNRSGGAFGMVAGGSIDLRAYGFVFGFDARYHGLVSLQSGDGRSDVQMLTVGAHIGFGFY